MAFAHDPVSALVAKLHDTPERIVLATSGAGAQAILWIQSVPGASRTLLEASIPYAHSAFTDYLGFPCSEPPPVKAVCAAAARMLAGRALTRARFLRGAEQFPVIGCSCTASLVTDRPRKGLHQAFFATWTRGEIVCYNLVLKKGVRTRLEEEKLVSTAIINIIATAFNFPPHELLTLDGLGEGDSMELVSRTNLNGAATKLLERSTLSFFHLQADGMLIEYEETYDDASHPTLAPHMRGRPLLVLAGAFNPLHEGHVGLTKAAKLVLANFLPHSPRVTSADGTPPSPSTKPSNSAPMVLYELTVRNVDKPPLKATDITERITQFAGRWDVVVTNAPTFVTKSKLLPGAFFVVGYDTATRILQKKYYLDSETEMEARLEEIRQNGCKFIVGGRALDEKSGFFEPSSLVVPEKFNDLFIPIPSTQFRCDISSTQLRSITPVPELAWKRFELVAGDSNLPATH